MYNLSSFSILVHVSTTSRSMVYESTIFSIPIFTTWEIILQIHPKHMENNFNIFCHVFFVTREIGHITDTNTLNMSLVSKNKWITILFCRLLVHYEISFPMFLSSVHKGFMLWWIFTCYCSLLALPHVVTMTNNLQNFAYIQISEPPYDFAIFHFKELMSCLVMLSKCSSLPIGILSVKLLVFTCPTLDVFTSQHPKMGYAYFTMSLLCTLSR